MLYSTSAWNGQVKFADPAYYLKKQLLATSLGLAAMYAVSCIDFRKWKNLAAPGYLISLVLQAAVLFFGDNVTDQTVAVPSVHCPFSLRSSPR